MRVLNIRMLFGIEIILLYNNIFQQILDKSFVDIINCAICESTVNHYRESYKNDFSKKYTEIAKFIMKDPRINVTTVDYIKQNFPNIDFEFCTDPKMLQMEFNIQETFNNDHLIDGEVKTDLPEKYITISTKSLNIPRSSFELYKFKIFDILNRCKLPIVILGEQDTKPCLEYTIHETYSMYRDFSDNLFNIIDRTIPSSENNNDILPLKNTFYILKNSSLNIFMSTSGVKRVTIYPSSNVLGLISPSDFHHFKNVEVFKPNVTITQDHETFIRCLDDKINSINTI